MLVEDDGSSGKITSLNHQKSILTSNEHSTPLYKCVLSHKKLCTNVHFFEEKNQSSNRHILILFENIEIVI